MSHYDYDEDNTWRTVMVPARVLVHNPTSVVRKYEHPSMDLVERTVREEERRRDMPDVWVSAEDGHLIDHHEPGAARYVSAQKYDTVNRCNAANIAELHRADEIIGALRKVVEHVRLHLIELDIPRGVPGGLERALVAASTIAKVEKALDVAAVPVKVEKP